MHRRPLLVPATLVAMLLAGPVAAADPSPSPEAWGGACSVPASPAPLATPGCGATATTVPWVDPVPVAVLSVDGEVYRIELTAPGALAGAYALATGDSSATIPSGLIVRDDPGTNAPWSWHIDPATLAWAEVTTEVCDGRPTQIEDGVFTGERFCPWSAQLVGIEHDPSAPGIGWTSDGTPLPMTASGGTSADDRTFAQRVELAGGSYLISWTQGAPVDPAHPACAPRISLGDGTQTMRADATDLDAAGAQGSLMMDGVGAGAYDLFVSIGCAWTLTLDVAP